MKAIDVSVYSGEISVEQWRQIKADGCDLAVVGLFHGRTANHYAAQQMRAAHEAGMLLAGYVLIAPWTGMTGGGQVEAGLEVAASELVPQLRFLAVDMEVDGVTEAMAYDALSRVEISEGLRAAVYTGWWWWYGYFKDNQTFQRLPLWTADYDGEANLDTRMYGGWTRAVGKQYAGTTMLHGVNCDLNFFDDGFVKEEEMPGVDWPKEKLKLLDDYAKEDRAFWDWVDLFPETQAEKDDENRQNMEDAWYEKYYEARQKMHEKQIAWRSPPR